MERVALIEGIRTPFVKSWTSFEKMNSLDLAKVAVNELLNKTELDAGNVDEIIMGTVFPPTYYPNIAREVIIALGLPMNIHGFTLTRACASGLQAVTSGAESIMTGRNKVVIAGGTESLSQLQVNYSQELVTVLQKISKVKSMTEKANLLTQLSLKDLIPSTPDIKELSTGNSMGEHAEKMARKYKISREEQDKYAYSSHLKAAVSISENKINNEIVTTYPPNEYNPVKEDNNIRKNPDYNSISKLKPVFDKNYGTVTAANASPLTDGASAVVLMSESKAKEFGYKPKAFIKSFEYASINPFEDLLLGNAFSLPKALKRAGLTINDIDIFEMHEAFAVQVLATLKCLSSKSFCNDKLGLKNEIEINPEIFNVSGGSIAIGHPFGATGGRILNTLANELQRREKQYGLISICAAGAMSVSMVIERE
jgi:acetyl-CoA acyltransferase